MNSYEMLRINELLNNYYNPKKKSRWTKQRKINSYWTNKLNIKIFFLFLYCLIKYKYKKYIYKLYILFNFYSLLV